MSNMTESREKIEDEMVVWANRSDDRLNALVRIARQYDDSEGAWSAQRAARVLAAADFNLMAVLLRLS